MLETKKSNNLGGRKGAVKEAQQAMSFYKRKRMCSASRTGRKDGESLVSTLTQVVGDCVFSLVTSQRLDGFKRMNAKATKERRRVGRSRRTPSSRKVCVVVVGDSGKEKVFS